MEFHELSPVTIITFESSTNVVKHELPGNASADQIRNAIYFGVLDIRNIKKLVYESKN